MFAQSADSEGTSAPPDRTFSMKTHIETQNDIPLFRFSLIKCLRFEFLRPAIFRHSEDMPAHTNDGLPRESARWRRNESKVREAERFVRRTGVSRGTRRISIVKPTNRPIYRNGRSETVAEKRLPLLRVSFASFFVEFGI